MKNIFLLLFTLFFSVSLFAQENAIKEAETAYTQDDYSKAIELYEGVLKTHGASAEIYYNLGNSYFKDGQVAPSILNYERALLLDPGDRDIRFNLNVAKQKTVDRIEPIGEFLFVKWFHGVQNMLSVNAWGAIGIICFILLIGCLILFFFSKWVHLKKIGFYVGLILVFIVILANVFAANQKHDLLNRNSAIVFSPTVTVKSSPDASGTDLFVIHEGTKVFVRNILGEWSEIELEDGNVGWMPSKDIEKI
ncbi:tetratricopeptide repeat protein [Massilibacteroides sp.]|uniref:tetratricopeptide repeat protein n=1 Tax=Massilibacteroides sp. TaxID=2034766 RepID=UPI00261155C0|nr:tetratricopeptide repeat protein [Massilibacteroides sp.]MDD4515127.1 tetratricopeptide repeat protein [Massilibacteroides sp.]